MILRIATVGEDQLMVLGRDDTSWGIGFVAVDFGRSFSVEIPELRRVGGMKPIGEPDDNLYLHLDSEAVPWVQRNYVMQTQFFPVDVEGQSLGRAVATVSARAATAGCGQVVVQTCDQRILAKGENGSFEVLGSALGFSPTAMYFRDPELFLGGDGVLKEYRYDGTQFQHLADHRGGGSLEFNRGELHMGELADKSLWVAGECGIDIMDAQTRTWSRLDVPEGCEDSPVGWVSEANFAGGREALVYFERSKELHQLSADRTWELLFVEGDLIDATVLNEEFVIAATSHQMFPIRL